MPISASYVNIVVAELPTPEGDYYTIMTPRWFAFMARVATASFGIAVIWFVVPVWREVPPWALFIACIVIIALLVIAINSKGWNRFLQTPLLHADQLGIYLPSHKPRTIGEKVSPRWLFVPWENLSNIRVDKAYIPTCDERGVVSCAAIEVVATSDEVDEYFFDLTERRSTRSIVKKIVPVGFYIRNIIGLPEVKEVVEKITMMANRHNNRLQSDAATPRA